MTGPTLTVTVSPAVESTTQSFPSLSPLSAPQIDSSSSSFPRSSSSHPRSWANKSIPDLPAYDLPSINFDAEFDVPFNASLTPVPDKLPEHTHEKPAGVSHSQSLGGSGPRPEKMVKRRSSLLARSQLWMPTKSTPDLSPSPREVNEAPGAITNGGGDKSPTHLLPQDGSRTASGPFASFARRSWMPTSRSPSPNAGQETPAQTPETRSGRERAPSNTSIMKLRKPVRTNSTSSSSDGSQSSESVSRIGSYLSRIKARPQAARVKARTPTGPESSASSTTSLAPPSTETRKSHASETSNITFPDDVPAAGIAPAVQDPLWTVFKTLDSDFQKFQSRTTGLKMNLVRSSLVPFLRTYAFHPSNLNLQNEELERRAVILDKWWTGLLEMLHVRTHPPVPGVDRPVLLDVLSNIMMRPEWRQSTPSFRPLAERNRQERTPGKSTPGSNKSTSSINSTDSAYLAESTGHNVRSMFIANLVAQMAIIVEKMSLRNAPNSLVNFAGKACAYAFFFAPGVADVLVRLWSLTPNALRRVANEFDLPPRSKGEGDDMVALFPPSLDKLGWTSVTSVSSALRNPAPLPLTSAKVSWNGPWLARWNGRDSDLFFIFCKYYFILAQGFMPSDLPLVEKARAPAFVLVNAQILSVLDSTIHRQAAVDGMATLLPDALNGANASAMALQMAPSNNALRGMAENRLVALLKNFLSDPYAFGSAPYTFAQSFLAVMRATVKHTSQYDHNACFTVCDFLEQSLIIYSDFTDGAGAQKLHVDWPFWFEVCKRILDSNNTMSEIRVLSLIFSIWETASRNQSRKESVCCDWLLSEETFDKFFNNWCPMVRAYYMRLLCWRICRDTGVANESDARIFQLVATRLKTVWSHYLWLKQHAEEESKLPPSTAPSFPTPGKRFMIIRTEIPAVQPSFMPGFDSTSPKQDISGTPPTDFDSIKTLIPEVVPAPKKSWSLFSKVLSFSANADTADELEPVRRDLTTSRNGVPPRLSTSVSPADSDNDSIGSSPTYEAATYFFKFMLSWNTAGTMAPPNRILTRPRLPSPAQSRITVKSPGGTPPLAASPPAPTRAVSGSPLPGLVDSARNQTSLEAPASPTDTAPQSDQCSSVGPPSDQCSSVGAPSISDLHEDDVPLRHTACFSKENLVNPAEPTGFYARTVKYSGRALAEWGLVVAECNSFVERRREEGVPGLHEVEVPALGVEGFRKICQ